MRTTKAELRRIIREAVRRKIERLDEAEGTVDMKEMVDACAGAMVTQLIERIDSTLGANAHEMVVSVTGDDVPRPGRYEDVGHYAPQVVDAVLSDPELKDALLTVAVDVIHGLMEPEDEMLRQSKLADERWREDEGL